MTDEIVSHGYDKDKLTLVVDGETIGGWEEVSVTLRAEGFPNSFQVKATMPPGGVLTVFAGDPCVVKMGGDTVITGFVDRVIDSADELSHSITIGGRGLSQDLVDCGAEWPSHQLINGNALTIAQQLASAYGLTVIMGNGASPGPDIKSFALNYGETGADIIQRVARNAGLLAYEDALGRVVLANAGSVTAASGATYGDNAQAWSVEHTLDQRFSDYVCCYVSNAAFDNGVNGPGGDQYYRATDPGVTRHRLHYLVVEAVAADAQEFTRTRARWEASRRSGRSFVVKATVDAWRDSAGTLWAPNTLIPLNGGGVNNSQTFVISEVTFRRSNDRGTIADIVAMPPNAFTPEPIVLQPVNSVGLVPLPPQKP